MKSTKSIKKSVKSTKVLKPLKSSKSSTTSESEKPLKLRKKSKSSLEAIKVAKLWAAAQGETEKYHFDEPINLGADIEMATNFKADLLLIKLKEEISAILSNIEAEIYQNCARCLKKYRYPIHIPSAEREFFMEVPAELGDPFDLFLIDRKAMTIDLTEMVRQEMILHFPFIPVCSKHCKGLCESCGIDLNKTSKHSPGCQRNSKASKEEEGMYKPFAHLKDLIK